ncbi:NAD-dependent epimerase/dehydratase family protein [Sanyastnella coralliicola]|uniref:NAD-dependent epimerase/dehydratase family protein n=1 Tax=Sanyastnella coralliicola TaxID=3069118 RepID=UPI0027B98212|nr:NAD-dependent epimerase/dehydratase family protein [Longitalea sp. SCSIO 12813]
MQHTIERSLVIGASGQIGVELLLELGRIHGTENVIGADIRPPAQKELEVFTFEHLNILNEDQLEEVLRKHNIDTVYNLAAMLSATAEKYPEKGWDLNMTGLFNTLNAAKKGLFKKLFWPSSIAVFGPTTPKENVPQSTITEPTTVYGISKLAGEQWCAYYQKQYGVDVRSIRYPGLIGHRSEPGGGTTDYAVDIFFKAVQEGKYTSFLAEDMRLPMMYMEDAIRATIELMQADAEKISVRTSYNINGVDFTPAELAEQICQRMPEFEISYDPDFRQQIAESWPSSIDDSQAANDWNWRAKTDVNSLVDIMLTAIQKKKELAET